MNSPLKKGILGEQIVVVLLGSISNRHEETEYLLAKSFPTANRRTLPKVHAVKKMLESFEKAIV